MKRVLGLAVLVLFAVGLLAACGGGGGSSSPPATPPSDNVMGTYHLTGFTIDLSDGTTITESSPIFTSWSGTMIIGDGTVSQVFVINGTSFPGSGTFTVTWIDNTSGIFHVVDASGAHDFPFWISGYDLTTYSGVIPDPFTPGLTFEEWDYWRKVSDSIATGAAESLEKQDARSAYPKKRWIGEMLTPHNAD